jgi:type VI secretion system ImpM family protein
MPNKPESESPSFLQALGSLLGGGPKVVRTGFSTYGKLPIYKDFLRHGLAAKEAQAFRHWLDRGFSRHWETNDACRDHRIEPHAFSLRFEGLARRVVGCLWESHDQGELRRFPFTLFVSVPVGGSFGELAALEALGRVAEEARDLRLAARDAGDVQGFYQRVREKSLTLKVERDAVVREKLADILREVPVRAFAESLYGAEAAVLWPALLEWLTQRRAAARKRDPAAPPLACRLPVSRLVPVLRQAQLWAAVLQGTGAKGKAPLNALLPWGTEPDGGLVFLERDIRPDDMLALHPDPPGYDLLEDLRKRVPGGKGTSPPSAMQLGEEPLSALLLPGALGD